jgi:DnaJ-class molecular chaperone
MYTFKERKLQRTREYEAIKGSKLRPCVACNGSGYYDHNGSPKCGNCNGSGKERYKPNTLLSHSTGVL